MEGLSFRLNNFENGIKKQLNINTEPRVNYNPPDPSETALFGQQPDIHGGAPAFGAPTFEQTAGHHSGALGQPAPQQNSSLVGKVMNLFGSSKKAPAI